MIPIACAYHFGQFFCVTNVQKGLKCIFNVQLIFTTNMSQHDAASTFSKKKGFCGYYCCVRMGTIRSVHVFDIVRGLWEGVRLTDFECPLPGPLGMPTRHVAHAST